MIIENAVNQELIIRQITQRELAQKLGTHPEYINDIIHGRRKSKPMQLRIAHALGKPVDALFPESKKETARTE